MPSHRHCVIPLCSNRADSCKFGLFPGEDGKYEKKRLCGSTETRRGCKGGSETCRQVSYHRLPTDESLRKRWLAAIPRLNTPLTANTHVCGQHFLAGRRSGPDDIPRVFVGRKVVRARSSRVSLLGLQSTPPDSPTVSPKDADEEATAIEVATGSDEPSLNVCRVLEEMTLQEQVALLKTRVAELKETVDSLRQDLEMAEKNAQLFRYSNVVLDEKVFRFYTGVTPKAFTDVMTVVGDSMDGAAYTTEGSSTEQGRPRGRGVALSKEDELLLTLCKLRHDFPESDLAARFSISQSTVSRIFRHWTLCLSFTFQELDIWPSQEFVRSSLPKAFAQYPSTRVIVDATEFPIDKPSNPDVQAATWSSYKNRNTLKLLVGCTPNGVISFVSELYGGRTSDKELTKRSGLVKKLQRGDSLMADRGFDIDGILPDGGSTNVPPFLAGRSQLEPEEVLSTRRIATVRIHVERAIERIKNFRITHHFPATLCPLAQHIVNTCAFLTLFEDPLLPSEHPLFVS